METEIAQEFIPFFRVYKDGRVERLAGTETVPPSDDPHTGVRSKDIVFSPRNGLLARLFLPRAAKQTQKLPLLIYIHGGGFSTESPFSPLYHNYLNDLVNKANVIAVSVQYRRAPEHLLPILYDDAWSAIQWVVSHANRDGPETWLNDHGDFDRLFLAGDSAGANISHNMAVRAGVDGLPGVKLVGIVLMHPYFGNNEPSEYMNFIFPSMEGCTDPRVNPAGGVADLAVIGCARVLICVASEDMFRDRGVTYNEALMKSGWDGSVAFVETEGEKHVFYLFNPNCEKARVLMNSVVSFINKD